MRLHEGRYPFRCEVCDMKFSTNHNKRAHMKVHQGDRPFKCPVCPYAGKTDLDCRAHIGVMHRHERIYRCDMCNLGFGRERGLLQHYETDKHEKNVKISLTSGEELTELKPIDETDDSVQITTASGIVIKMEPFEEIEDANYNDEEEDSMEGMVTHTATVEMLDNGDVVLRPVKDEPLDDYKEDVNNSQNGNVSNISVLEGSVVSLRGEAHGSLDMPDDDEDDEQESAVLDHIHIRDQQLLSNKQQTTTSATTKESASLPEGTIGTITIHTDHNFNKITVKAEENPDNEAGAILN